ncbi:MAG: alpha/beta fold hydrolase [Clostridia bacterium]|nr:alpha/beta fold hydrolase [Clostridia bacterium]
MNLVNRFYKNNLVHRYDDDGYIRYFCAADFPGLQAEGISFYSGENKLKGYIYSYEGCSREELIVFCHGLGGGHRSYMREIELLCKNGYPVLAYDNTGCFESEGDSIICLSQSLADLDHALCWLKSEGIFGRYKKVYVVGHSWGGYAAGNIAAFHSDISKVVVISGFISVKQMLKSFFAGTKMPLKSLIVYLIYRFEKKANPKYCDSTSLQSLSQKDTEFLLAHSTDDPTVSYEFNTKIAQNTAAGSNVSFLICKDKMHNPNYSSDAVKYMVKVFGEFQKANKNLKTTEEKQAFFADVDWFRMTEQDMDFWKEVLAFLAR